MARPKKYSDEMRERSVRLAMESDRPIKHVQKARHARPLGIVTLGRARTAPGRPW